MYGVLRTGLSAVFLSLSRSCSRAPFRFHPLLSPLLLSPPRISCFCTGLLACSWSKPTNSRGGPEPRITDSESDCLRRAVSRAGRNKLWVLGGLYFGYSGSPTRFFDLIEARTA